MDLQARQLKWQQTLLITIRFLIGWHFLYEGLHKLIHPEWSAIGFLAESKWIFSGIADRIISNPGLLNVVDALNTWGLIAIGLGLILGLFTRIASLAGTILLLLYYLFNPPFIGMGLGPAEGNYLIVNKNLIEAAMLLLLAVSPQSIRYGLDSLLKKKPVKS